LDLIENFCTFKKLSNANERYPASASLSYNKKLFQFYTRKPDVLYNFILQARKYLILTDFSEKYYVDVKLGGGSYADVISITIESELLGVQSRRQID